MATNKPRIQVTVSAPVYETISRMAKLQGISRSAIVNDLLETVHPPLMRTVAILEAAQDAPEQVKAGLRGSVEALEAQLVGIAGGLTAQMDWLLEAARNGSTGEGKAGSGRSPGPVSTPVPVTRGSGQRKSLKSKETAKSSAKKKNRASNTSRRGVRS